VIKPARWAGRGKTAAFRAIPPAIRHSACGLPFLRLNSYHPVGGMRINSNSVVYVRLPKSPDGDMAAQRSVGITVDIMLPISGARMPAAARNLPGSPRRISSRSSRLDLLSYQSLEKSPFSGTG